MVDRPEILDDFEVRSGASVDGLRIGLVGKLAGMTKREAQRLIRAQGGIAVDALDESLDLVVVGDEVLLSDGLLASESLLDETTREAAEQGMLHVISETQLWQRLGLVERDHNVRRLYTPAMLAELVGSMP